MDCLNEYAPALAQVQKIGNQLFFPSVFDMTSFDYRTGNTADALFIEEREDPFLFSFQGPIADICVFSLFYR